jgi:MFS family permease
MVRLAVRADVATPEGRRQAFRRLLAGSSLSMLGSRMTSVAYPMLVLYLTSSAFAAGWVAFAATAPSLVVYVPAGALVDRLDPRKTMLICEFGRGVAIGIVVAKVAISKPSVMLLIVAAVVEETLEMISSLAERRYVWTLIEPGEAASALVPTEARTHATVLAGRPLGGFLFGIKPILPFAADMLSFFASIGAIISMKNSGTLKARIRRPDKQPLLADIRDGLRWLFNDKYSRAAITLASGATLVSQALLIVFLAAAHARGVRSIETGSVLAASGVGGMLGTVAASRFMLRQRVSQVLRQASHMLFRASPLLRRGAVMLERTSVLLERASVILVQMVAWTIAIALLAISGGQSMIWMAFALAVLGFTGALGNIEAGRYLLSHIEDRMLARVASVAQLCAFGACAAGPFVGGLLTQQFGIQAAVWCLLGATMLLTVISLFSPSMRHSTEFKLPEEAPATAGSPL